LSRNWTAAAAKNQRSNRETSVLLHRGWRLYFRRRGLRLTNARYIAKKATHRSHTNHQRLHPIKSQRHKLFSGLSISDTCKRSQGHYGHQPEGTKMRAAA